MTMNPAILLAVGAVGLMASLLLLYLGIQMLREERAKKDAAATDTPATGTPEGEAAPPAAPVVKPPPAKPARSRGSAHEVLRVLRDNLTGRLVIEIAGRRYASLDELTDPALSDGLLTTLGDLQTFTGAAALPPGEPTALPVARTIAPPPLAATPAAQPATGPAPSGPPKPLPPPSMNPFKQMQVLRELAKNQPPEPKSITEQINDVLQAQIAGTLLAERKLRMRMSARGEAQFDLDGESYPSVDEVPDMEVRETLKAAIAAWEQTQ